LNFFITRLLANFHPLSLIVTLYIFRGSFVQQISELCNLSKFGYLS